MDIEQAIRERRSVREFTSEDVPIEVVNEILELASWAPSAGNLQSRDFVVVRVRGTREDIARAAGNQYFIAQAPVVVVVTTNNERVAHYGRRGRDLYTIQDAAAAAQNVLLLCHVRGLGSVWVGAFDEKEVGRILGLPHYVRPVVILPIGHPAEAPTPREHLRFEEYTHFEKW